jgi:hypothetical protein
MESPYPLDESPEITVDSQLVGSWLAQNPEDESESFRLDVYSFNDLEYVVLQTESSPDKEPETSLLRAFMSEVGGERFVNVQCVSCGDEDREYLFLKVDQSGDELVVVPFSGESFSSDANEFKSAADARRYVSERLRNTAFYADPMVFKRITEKP